MKFIDLFAGLGGFRMALADLGHECVFACEIDPNLKNIYEKNFNCQILSDIRDVDVSQIPSHDILCAGFPCQPFSKAGHQNGFKHDDGNLFHEIMRILNHHKPQYLILENVANLKKHDNGNTWHIIENDLKKAGYTIRDEILSPHKFGVPQIRDRIFIVGCRDGLDHFSWPNQLENEVEIRQILEENPTDVRLLGEEYLNYLAVWQEFVDRFPRGQKIPLPIWSMEFGATYPFEFTTPHTLGFDKLRQFKGSYGQPLENLTDTQIIDALPSYAYSHSKAKINKFQTWKINYIRMNRELYNNNQNWLDEWIPRVRGFYSSFQKFEWNCGMEQDRNLSNYLIQFRGSGIRVKRATYAPALVGITSQIPVIGWESRFMTRTECARLQSMDRLQHWPETFSQVTKALGNAVNVEVVRLIAQALIQ